MLIIVSLSSGCARTRPAITSLWQQVPPVRWPGKETHPDRGSADNLAEPAVAANVALQQDSISLSESTSEVLARGEETSAGGKSKSPPRRLGLPLISSDRETEGTFSDLNSREPNEATHAHPTETDQFNSPLERLNAALTDDVRHAMTLPRRSVTALEERFRVDSLISRAKEHFATGQLDRAHEAAIAAQELSDTAQLDYAPDEDRPLDLVRRIEGQMDATRLTQEPGTADESSAATRTEEPEETSQLSTQLATPPVKEAKGTPKTPRNWSTFFRREKKPAASAPEDLVTQGPLTHGPLTQISSEAIRNTSRADRIDSHGLIKFRRIMRLSWRIEVSRWKHGNRSRNRRRWRLPERRPLERSTPSRRVPRQFSQPREHPLRANPRIVPPKRTEFPREFRALYSRPRYVRLTCCVKPSPTQGPSLQLENTLAF